MLAEREALMEPTFTPSLDITGALITSFEKLVRLVCRTHDESENRSPILLNGFRRKSCIMAGLVKGFSELAMLNSLDKSSLNVNMSKTFMMRN